MPTHRHPYRSLAVAAFAAVTLAACSGGNTPTSTAAASQDAGPPQSGGTLRVNSLYDTKVLDPQVNPSYETLNTVKFVYSKLMAYKTGPDVPYGTDELVGDLAESWEANEDATVWTVHLRKGVTWQNIAPVNGREFTAKDVLCTTDRITSLPAAQQSLLAYVSEIAAPDDYTLTFTLSQPYVAFDENLAAPSMLILPCEGTDGTFDLKAKAIGTGPFMLENWTPGDKQRVFTKNPDYYEAGKPYLDSVTQTYVLDPQALISAARSGQFDLVYENDPAVIDTIVKANPTWSTKEEGGLEQARVFLNATREPFTDARVRRAISLAIDKQGMIKAVSPGTSLTGPVAPTIADGLSTEQVDKLTPYDPDEAKALLAEAGQTSFSTKILVNTAYGEANLRRAQWVQQDLAAVGITSEIVEQDQATYIGAWTSKDYDMVVGAMAGALTADLALSTEWTSTGARNYTGINDPKLDEMITAQRSIADPTERKAALEDIQSYILTDVADPIPLHNFVAFWGVSDKVQNYYPHPDFSFLYYKDIWLKQ